MDDLLALFDENPPEEPQRPPIPDPDDDDDDDNEAKSQRRTQQGQGRDACYRPLSVSRGDDNNDLPTIGQTTNSQQQQQQQMSSTVDARVDIRMVKRKVSSIDLLDMISSSNNPPYHSPASLAAMSSAQLNRLLLDPAAAAAVAVVDTSTVQGRANLMTVGIVFSNSGTRLTAASGNAFCILTIGTLRTGPCVTILLFGGAYGQHVKQCKPGMVVAVVSPKIMPPKNGESRDTSITFSCNDARQITLLAGAQDYVICQGRVRGKNQAGVWVSDAKPCRTVVDKRVCLYCPLHRHQQKNTKNKNDLKAVAAANGRGTTTKMQALRLESSIASNNSMNGSQRRMTLPQQMQHQHSSLQGSNTNTHTSRSDQMLRDFQAKQSGPRFRQTGALLSISSSSSLFSQNSLLRRPVSSSSQNHHQQQQQQREALIAPPKSASEKILRQRPAPSKINGILNPYSIKKQVTPDPTNAMGQRAAGQATAKSVVKHHQQRVEGRIKSRDSSSKVASAKPVLLHNILQPPLHKRGATKGNDNNNKRPRKSINTVSLSGFDGSVVVPKPRIFAAAAAASNTGIYRSSFSNAGQDLPASREATQASAIRAKQQQMAARMRENQSQNKQQRGNSSDERPTSRDRLFGTMNDSDRERLLSAKSQFADEAKSEEYARSRKVVVELEKQEEKKNKQSSSSSRNKDKKNGAKDSQRALIQKVWHCRTCGKSYPKRPRFCEQAGHRVVMSRDIQKQQSTAEKRTDISKNHLKLGSGLDWSYNRFS